MTHGPEYLTVEKPFVDQLVAMGWTHTPGDLDEPAKTGRSSFREVLLLDDLRSALRRIHRDPDGTEWLDDARFTQAVNALQRLGTAKLVEANQQATELLLKGATVEGIEGRDQGRTRVAGRLSAWERARLARRFARGQHPNVTDPERAFVLGDGETRKRWLAEHGGEYVL